MSEKYTNLKKNSSIEKYLNTNEFKKNPLNSIIYYAKETNTNILDRRLLDRKDIIHPLNNFGKKAHGFVNSLELPVISYGVDWLAQALDQKGRVSYDKLLPVQTIACYSLLTNDVKVGPMALIYTDEFLRGILKHEKSHNVFATLNEAAQGELISLFSQHHREDIELLYVVLRSAYSADYFDPKQTEKNANLARTLGRGRRVVKQQLIKNGDKFEMVDVARVVDEVIAYMQMASGFENTFKEDPYFDFLLTAVRQLSERLDPAIQRKLAQYGFDSISVDDMIQQLQEDEAYKLAKVMQLLKPQFQLSSTDKKLIIFPQLIKDKRIFN